VLRKTLSFFHLLGIQPTFIPEPANAAPSLASAVIPMAKAEPATDRMPAVLERGNYSILDAKGYVLVAHITMPDVRKLAPQIAKERHQCVRILKHAG
jgi:hypothetical protein